MTKVTFEQVGKAAQDMVSRGNTLWALMVAFAVANMSAAIKSASDDKGESLKSAFKLHEAQYKEKHDANLNTIGAYRSAKSVISAASRYAVTLVNEKGDARGKSEVEKAIDELREKASAAATIQRSLTTIDNKLGEVSKKEEVAAIYLLVKALHDKCAKLIEEKGVKKTDLKKVEKQVELA